MKLYTLQQRRTRMDIIPLIDVMFIVLISFIYAVFSMTSLHGIDVDLPAIKAEKDPHNDLFTISISREGNIYANGEMTKVNDLTDIIKNKINQTPGLQVLIQGDREAHHGIVVEILNAIQRAEVYKVSIQTIPDSEKEGQ